MERIKQLMKREKIANPYRLSKLINVDYRVVNHWFTGRSKPNEDNLTKISSFFRVPLSWLRYGTEEYKPQIKDELIKVFERATEYISRHPEDTDKIKQLIMVATTDKETLKKDTAISPYKKKRRIKSA